MGETWKDIHDLLKKGGKDLADPEVIRDLHSVVDESKGASKMVGRVALRRGREQRARW